MAGHFYGSLDMGDPSGILSTSWVFFDVSEGGVMNADIGGPTPGAVGHDQLAQVGIFSTCSMGGRLHLRFRNGFTPTPGDSFRLTSGMGGSFADITCDGAHAFHAEYVSGGLNLKTVSFGAPWPAYGQAPANGSIRAQALRQSSSKLAVGLRAMSSAWKTPEKHPSNRTG